MEIRGKEIQFLRTVKATCELAKLCPDQDIERVGELFNGTMPTTVEIGAKIIHFLNEGFEMNKHYNDPTYQPQVISVDEIMYLTEKTYVALMKEAMASFGIGTETSIETVEVGSKKKKETE